MLNAVYHSALSAGNEPYLKKIYDTNKIFFGHENNIN